MQSRYDATDNNRHGNSCEIIQEIYGLGPYYLLREDEEKLFQRLVAKYQQHGCSPNEIEADEVNFEISIRKAISHRKAELATGGFYNPPPRKESLLSSGSRAQRGTSDKDAADSPRVIRRIHLG